MEWENDSMNDGPMKTYEIKQVGADGCMVAEHVYVQADSGESAARQLSRVADGTESIRICLDGDVMNEMGVDYWQKRIRRR